MNLLAQVIDGSILEGGGQLIRNSVALSALLRKPISIHKVRNSRKPPGLKNQHVAGIKLVGDICSAKMSGVQNASCAFDFEPGSLQVPGNYTADPGTAGSITLLLQVSVPCLLFSLRAVPSRLTLRGGTNASQAPQVDYTKNIFFPFLRRHFGLNPTLKIDRRGYFPRGGGSVSCSLTPRSDALPPLTLLERGAIKSIRGEVHVSGLPERMAYTIRDAAINKLSEAGVGVPEAMGISAYRVHNEDAIGAGAGITLFVETEGGCIIGGSALSSKRGQDPSDVGIQAASELLANLEHGGCVDEYLQDQIIIFMALAEGTSTVFTGPLTLHTRTAIWTAEQLTDAKFEVEEKDSGNVIIRCKGIGYTAIKS